MSGRLFQRFQQRVERPGREHVHFVDDIDFVAGRSRAVMHRIDDFANVGDACVRCGVHLHHIDVSPFHDRGAVFALPARGSRRPAGAINADAVHALGDDPRGRGFTCAPDARHHKGLRNAVRLERVFQRAHHGVLAHEVGKGFGSVFAGQNLIGGGFRHW